MPTPALMRLPLTISPEEFECLCADVLAERYSCFFQIYGGKGQRQYGIDLYTTLENGTLIVAQCKNYYKATIDQLIANLVQDIIEARKKFQFDTFIAMTSVERNTKVQDEIMKLKYPFHIDVMFWDEIQATLCANNKLLAKYYPTFFNHEFIGALNIIISIVEYLSSAIQTFNTKYKHHIIATDQRSDTNIYNNCVDVFNSIKKLYEIKCDYNIQLYNMSIKGYIDKLVELTPEFYDAQNDITGTNMIVTVSNFIKYYSNDDTATDYLKICNDIIRAIRQLNNSQ